MPSFIQRRSPKSYNPIAGQTTPGTGGGGSFVAAWAEDQQNIICGGLDEMFRKNTAGQFICFRLVSSTDGSAVTGATVSVRRCIDGTFAAATGTVTEDSAGFYKFAMSQADTNGNDISFYFTATGAIGVEKSIVTTAADPTVATNFGLSALPTASPGAANGVFIAGSNAATTISGLTTGALACTTITASGAVAFQSTFAVTGTTSLAALSTSGTATFNALTVTNATTLSGAVSLGSTL